MHFRIISKQMETTIMATKPKTTAAPKANGNFIAHFVADRDTKGTFVFRQVNEAGEAFTIEQGAQIGSLYIRKSAYGGKEGPARITVTVVSE
jgi:hypothetical protein